MENIPENIKTIINSCYPYIEDFNPAQKAVIESGYLENKNQGGQTPIICRFVSYGF